MKKKNKLFLLLLICISFIIIFHINHKHVLLYRKANGLYQVCKSKKTKITSLYDTNYQTNGKDIILFSDFRNLYSYNVNNNIKKLLLENPKDFYILDKNSFVVLNNNNTLYTIIGTFKSLIEKKVKKISIINNDTILYDCNGKRIIYNISSRKKKVFDNFDSFTFSLNKKNIIIKANSNYYIYNIKKNKIISRFTNIDDFLCINKDCTNLFYVKDRYLYSTLYKNKILDKNIYRILNNDKEQLIYSKYKNDKFVLYYKDGSKKTKKIDERNNEFTDVSINGSKINYLVGGVYVNRTVLKIRNEIDCVSQLIKSNNGKTLLLKGDDLYDDDHLLAKNVVSNSIKIVHKKIYYLKKGKDGFNLYYKLGNKEKLISRKVYNYVILNNTIYYLSNYNEIESSGDLYTYHIRKKLIDKDVSEILSIDS